MCCVRLMCKIWFMIVLGGCPRSTHRLTIQHPGRVIHRHTIQSYHDTIVPRYIVTRVSPHDQSSHETAKIPHVGQRPIPSLTFVYPTTTTNPPRLFPPRPTGVLRYPLPRLSPPQNALSRVRCITPSLLPRLRPRKAVADDSRRKAGGAANRSGDDRKRPDRSTANTSLHEYRYTSIVTRYIGAR